MGKPIAGIFGSIDAPPGVEEYGGGTLAGFRDFLNNIIQLVIVIAGIYAFINILLAGFAFISAGDDPKKIQSAWAKIWQTLIGLTVAVGAFVLAALIGKVLFGEYDALLQLKYVTP